MLAHQMRYGQKLNCSWDILESLHGRICIEMMCQDHGSVLCLRLSSALHRRRVLAAHPQSPLIITTTAASSRSPYFTVYRCCVSIRFGHPSSGDVTYHMKTCLIYMNSTANVGHDAEISLSHEAGSYAAHSDLSRQIYETLAHMAT